MVSKLLLPISPLNGYSKEFEDNILEEVADLGVISLATSVENKILLDLNIKKIFKVDLPVPGKSSLSKDGKFRIVGLSIDQWLAIFKSDESDPETVFKNTLSDDVYFTTQTDAWVILRMSGPLALKALERICPINLDPMSIIVDLRRYLVMEQSSAPTELNNMFSNIENNGAPWQFPAADRLKWIEEQ